MSMPLDRIASLSSQEKRRLLAQLLQNTARSSQAPSRAYPLSYGQQALWLIHQQAPQSWAYHMVCAARIRSHVDMPALQQAFQVLVDRHASLRTTYTVSQGQPVQRIQRDVSVDCKMVDATAETWDTLYARLHEEARQPFDLERGPMMRVRLFRRSKCDYGLLMTLHHIAIDFWSLGLLLQEFCDLYATLRAGQDIALLMPPTVTYTDYLRWQTAMLAGAEGERLWAYWQQRLAGALPALDLPTDRPRPALPTYRGASHPFSLSQRLTQDLQVLAQREGATLYMVLLAAFQILLYRYTGQDDILVGSPVALRHKPQFRQLVGYCVNPVVMRGQISKALTCRAFLRQIRHTVLEALCHADYPFPLLVERLQPKRDASRSPLFQACLVLQTLPHQDALLALFMPAVGAPQRLVFGDLVLEPCPLPQQEGQFDLTLEMAEIGASLCGMLQYNTDVLDAPTAARMVQHIQAVLAGMAAAPDQSLHTLPLLTPTERRQLLTAWPATATLYPRHQCIHQAFEAQVARTPEAVAVVCEDESLTYAALNRCANQLAHALQAQGVGPETRVGMCIERSLDLVVSILAILKAGGAYVPLDPTYPRDRLAFMLMDTQTSILLTQSHLLSQLPDTAAKVVCVDTVRADLAGACTANPASAVSADHLAYVMYTSGSTGQPKGIGIIHRSVVRLVVHTNFATLTADDVLLQCAPVAFDAATFELWGSLLNGGRLVLPPPCPLSLDTLARLIEAHRVSTLWLTAGLFQLMVDERPEALRAVRQLLAGGDVLSAGHVRRALATLADGVVINGYGPTENTTFTCCYVMTKAQQVGAAVPIGRPVSNTHVYILDAYLQPVPIGVTGELYAGGDGLARGYLNRPELTAAHFIPHPFGAGRLYKTGDRARYRPDGSIEFLGRVDNQVKIHGHRIEPDEIEAVLVAHPAVREALVTVWDEPSGSQHLVAYVVPQERAQVPAALAVPAGTPGWQAMLRHHVQQKLPAYMVPTAFVWLAALPLTPNGKIDRRTLPPPPLSHLSRVGPLILPRTPVEAQVAAIWCRVLGLEQVDVHANFFELGGHSLQAMQLISLVAATCHIDVPVQALFSHPTVATLAQALAAYAPSRTRPAHTARPMPPGRATMTPSNAHGMQPTSPFTTLVRQPLLPSILSGDRAPVDAAALAYLPVSLLDQTGASRDVFLADWCEHRPNLLSLLETPWGRIALIVLPCWSDRLYDDAARLQALTLDALMLARQSGAKTVSLTGLLPSATDYGRAITAALAPRQDLPQLSTGHATTTSAVVMMIEKLLHEGGRHLSQECVGCLGLGSIGRTALYLMLSQLPHPASILLCDVYQKRQTLEAVQAILIDTFGFQGSIHIVTAQPDVPPAFYDATLIVGATNVPDLLDVNLMQPGTMIVDDSAPHCFRTASAVQRLQQHQDVLFTEGGMVRSPHPIRECRYVPSSAAAMMTVQQFDAALMRHDPYAIMGCTLSGLLSARFAHLQPTLGLVEIGASRQHHAVLRQLGFAAATLSCEGYVLPAEALQRFRLRFGRAR